MSINLHLSTPTMSTVEKEELEKAQEAQASEPEAIKNTKHDNGGTIVLVPQPTDDPDDPLVSYTSPLKEDLSGGNPDKWILRISHYPQRFPSSCAYASLDSQTK